MNFLKENELKLSKKFINDGFIIKDIKNLESLYYLRDKIIKSSTLITRDKQNEKSKFLNTIHHMVKIKELNDFRLKIFRSINRDIKFRKSFYEISRDLLDALVGNELAMQKELI